MNNLPSNNAYAEFCLEQIIVTKSKESFIELLQLAADNRNTEKSMVYSEVSIKLTITMTKEGIIKLNFTKEVDISTNQFLAQINIMPDNTVLLTGYEEISSNTVNLLDKILVK